MKKTHLISILVFLMFIFSASCVFSDIIHFDSKKIEGHIVEETPSSVVIDISIGRVTIEKERISKIERTEPEYFQDKETLTGIDKIKEELSGQVAVESIRKEKEKKKCFLWEVSPATSTVYILGSIHFAKEDFYPLDETIEQVFDKSDILVVEINVTEADQFKTQELLNKIGLYFGGETLEKHLSKETLKLLKLRLNKLGISIEQVNKYKPWSLALNLVTLEFQRLGFSPQYGIDVYFLKKAKGSKKILELETFDYQINLLNNFSDYEQDLFLLETLVGFDNFESEIDKVIDAWSSGDAEIMEGILTKSLIECPQLLSIYEKFLYERNRNMVSKIEKFLKTGENYFIVVGAAHLIGKNGIIQLLKQKGYVVKQL